MQKPAEKLCLHILWMQWKAENHCGMYPGFPCGSPQPYSVQSGTLDYFFHWYPWRDTCFLVPCNDFKESFTKPLSPLWYAVILVLYLPVSSKSFPLFSTFFCVHRWWPWLLHHLPLCPAYTELNTSCTWFELFACFSHYSVNSCEMSYVSL